MTFASIHLIATSDTAYGAGMLPGCTNHPGCAFFEVILPEMGLRTTRAGSILREAII